jgi:hypothetical protein
MNIWKQKDNKIYYVPSNDGEFEKWMDENESAWTQSSSGTIEFYREIWEAARKKYGEIKET